jgi:methyl-accepting chemotaxis protein
MDLAISTYLDALQESRQKAEETRAENLRQQMQALASFRESLSQMSAGNLTARLESDLGPDFADLKRDFNGTAEQLQNVIVAVLSSMRIIESGNSELAHASDDLARRTEQQAASLEQTTAALSQITEGVKTTTDGVAHARKVAETATKDAAHTSEIVSRSKVAMEEIQSATAKIGQITEVIDEIAFQTNLLALNAGVEAARAGESGRGFAVVATEVRSLAQRASQSAKDIKVLIDHATTSVAEGATLVASTDDALGRFVLQVKEINSIIGGIADTAQDQTTGLSEVNLAVGHLDRATQQNAAMVEQATAATQSLAQEARKLSQHLGFFKVASGGASISARHESTPAPAKERVRRVAGGSGKSASAPAADGWTEF